MSTDILESIASWKEKLLDLSKRNPLVNCKLGKSGNLQFDYPQSNLIWKTIVVNRDTTTFPWKSDLLDNPEENGDTTNPDAALLPSPSNPSSSNTLSNDKTQPNQSTQSEPAEFEACLRSIKLDSEGGHILTRLTDKALNAKLRRLMLSSQTSLSEQGVHTLYLAFGFLRWYESKDSKDEITTPLVLVPVNVFRESLDSNWELCISDEEVVLNHCLVQIMKNDFNIDLPEIDDDNPLEEADSFLQLLQEVREAVSGHERWRVTDNVALGTFSFQKLAMWYDMGVNQSSIKEHPVCQGMAGIIDVNQGDLIYIPQANELDNKVPPHEVFHILEADSSQHEAIEAVKRGVSLVLDGPPGTGKSQTIANMIAESIAAGKTVLFVSEKSAALEVVKKRLDNAYLGDFCLECHSHKANKKAIVDELGRCMELTPDSNQSLDQRYQELQQLRQRLNGYVQALHKQRGALGKLAFSIHGCLSALSPITKPRFSISSPLSVNLEKLNQVREALNLISKYSAIIANRGNHPWRDCRLESRSLIVEDSIQQYFKELLDLISSYEAAFRELKTLDFIGETPTFKELDICKQLADEASQYPTVPTSWFQGNPKLIASAYSELLLLTDQFQEIKKKRNEFVEEAIDGDWVVWRDKLQYLSLNAERLSLDAHQSVRDASSHLGHTIPYIESLLKSAQLIKQYVSRIEKILFAPQVAQLPISRLPKLAKVADLISSLGQVSVDWFDSTKRNLLKDIVTHGKLEAVLLNQERHDLENIFKPSSFDPSIITEIKKAKQNSSFFKRFLPRWKKYRSRLQSLYIEIPAKSTSQLLIESSKLLDYILRYSKLLEIGKENQNLLRSNEQGIVDWVAIQEDLDRINEIEMTVKLPSKAREAIHQNHIDKEGLSETAHALVAEHQTFTAILSELQNKFKVFPRVDKNSLTDKSIAEIELFLNESLKAGIELRNIYQAIAGMLKSGSDIEISKCSQIASEFEILARLKASIKREYSTLGSIDNNDPTPENSNWSEKTRLSRWLLEFHEKYGPNYPQPLVEASTNPSVRERISIAARQIAAIESPMTSKSWSFLCELFNPDANVSEGITINAATAQELVSWLEKRIIDSNLIGEWLEFKTLENTFARLGISEYFIEIFKQSVDINEVQDAFFYRFYRIWLDAVYAEDPLLRNFNVDDHEKCIERFRSLDKLLVDEGYKRIRTKCMTNAPGRYAGRINTPGSSEMGILEREITKKRRHLPLRQLFDRIPSMLQRLKPCMMMSPLAVSTYLKSAKIRFDLVIFDEASQVRPHDAICSIYRGRQLVIAGDQKQLPPTSFFERQSESFEDNADSDDVIDRIEDFESILDVCTTLKMPRKRLRWHYRSRRESLIAFSNENFYSGELVTFPSIRDVDGNSAVRLEFISNGRWQGGSGESFNIIEAARTADMVIEHARSNPDQSLGVITMNQAQQVLVIEEVEKRRLQYPELEEFFAEESPEPFFVKNLENVQGDERDVIFFSIAYAPDQTGNFSMRFGPLNNEGGERRLNVAITRARHSLTVISSIKSSDIDLSRAKSRGAGLLKAYLDYAERGVNALKSVIREDDRDTESPFEDEVARELEKRGLKVRKQVGCGSFRIDLALVDPKNPGRYVLGIECDGATYHRSATARDRDRLRQTVLEDLGWRICRIWSTEWVRDRNTQVKKVVEAYNASLASPPESTPMQNPKSKPNPPQKQKEKPATPINDRIPRYNYSQIENVPTNIIDSLVKFILKECGTTEKNELIVSVTRHLGFERTGNKIKTRIQKSLHWMVKEGFLEEDETGRIRIKGN